MALTFFLREVVDFANYEEMIVSFAESMQAFDKEEDLRLEGFSKKALSKFQAKEYFSYTLHLAIGD